MADNRMLTDHDEIRDWAAARNGTPVIREAAPSVGASNAVIEIAFGQAIYQDQDMPERPPTMGGLEMGDWDAWFEIFDKNELALIVHEDVPGVREGFHEIVRR